MILLQIFLVATVGGCIVDLLLPLASCRPWPMSTNSSCRRATHPLRRRASGARQSHQLVEDVIINENTEAPVWSRCRCATAQTSRLARAHRSSSPLCRRPGPGHGRSGRNHNQRPVFRMTACLASKPAVVRRSNTPSGTDRYSRGHAGRRGGNLCIQSCPPSYSVIEPIDRTNGARRHAFTSQDTRWRSMARAAQKSRFAARRATRRCFEWLWQGKQVKPAEQNKNRQRPPW